MDDQLKELLKSLKAAQDILEAEKRRHASRRHVVRPDEAEDARSRKQGGSERALSLGDVARKRADYERE